MILPPKSAYPEFAKHTFGREMHNLWLFEQDVFLADKFDRRLLRDEKLGVQNTHELAIAQFNLKRATNSLVSDDIPLPDGFIAPRLCLPLKAFAPDYFTFGGYGFCSRKLRSALAQPGHVAQFTPVELVQGGPEVKAQDYKLMRVIAKQPAMDIQRSECEREEHVNHITGEVEIWPSFIRRFVLLEGLKPATEIFRMKESMTNILVTDALAERVLRAGCTGMEFVDPENEQFGPRMLRYRTADGIAERPVHMP